MPRLTVRLGSLSLSIKSMQGASVMPLQLTCYSAAPSPASMRAPSVEPGLVITIMVSGFSIPAMAHRKDICSGHGMCAL